MTQEEIDIREEMASGRWFDAADPMLEKDRTHANEIMRRFNSDLTLGVGRRLELLQDLFGSFGRDSMLQLGAQVDYGYNIFVGDNCFFNFNCIFLDGAAIRFGDNVWVGPNVTFSTPIHPLLAEERNTSFDEEGVSHLAELNKEIVVEDNVWIAASVTVNPGVTIGEGAVIASGSVVTKDIPPRVLAAGVPCKPLRELAPEDSVAKELARAGL